MKYASGEKPSLRDVVRVSRAENSYSDCTVSAIFPDGTVDLFRPYVHTADFAYAARDGGSRVITYIGFEETRNVEVKNYRLIRKGDSTQ